MLLSGSGPWNRDGGLGRPPAELRQGIRYKLLGAIPRRLGDYPSHLCLTIEHALSLRGQLVENLFSSYGSTSTGSPSTIRFVSRLNVVMRPIRSMMYRTI